MIKKFRHKPTEVRAVKWDGTSECLAATRELATETAPYCVFSARIGFGEKPWLAIETSDNGYEEAEVGHWIVKDSEGKMRPVENSYFLSNYEEIPQGTFLPIKNEE